MALDAETKKLFAGDQWAIDGDRLDVESTDGAPVIDRSIGFQSEFSTTKTINREKLNQIICELSGAAKSVREGIPAFDAAISYPPGSVVKVNGEMYYQGSDTNSTGVQPTSAGNGVWSLVGGVSQVSRTIPPALSASQIIVDGTRADRFSVRAIIDSTGGYAITRIDVRYSKSSSFSSGVSTETNYTQGEDILISNRDSDLYYVQVKLWNQLGDSNWSSTKDVGSALLPQGPNWATATPANQSAVVEWGGSSDNGLTISSHTIEYKTTSQAWSAATSVSVTNSNGYGPGSHTITGLTNGTAYNFRVRAVSNRNTTGVVREASATPAPYPIAPSAPSVGAVALSQTEILAYISGDTNNNGSAITGYKYQMRTSGGTWGTETSTQTTPYYIFDGLAADTDYEVRARAINAIGEGNQGSDADVSTLEVGDPGTPGIVAVRDTLGSAIYYIKGDIANEGGAAITKYRVRYKASSDEDWNTPIETTNAGGKITGLNPKTTYDAQLGVHNGTNWSDYSTSASIPAWDSSGPSGVYAYVQSGGLGKVVVSVAGELYTSDTINGYVWEYKLSTASTWTALAKSTTSTQVITGLTGGTAYNFRVTADDIFGSTTSSPVNFTTDSSLSWSGITPWAPVEIYDSDLSFPNFAIIWQPRWTDPNLNARLGGLNSIQWQLQDSSTSVWRRHDQYRNREGDEQTYHFAGYGLRSIGRHSGRHYYKNTVPRAFVPSGSTMKIRYRVRTSSLGWSNWSTPLTIYTLN